MSQATRVILLSLVVLSALLPVGGAPATAATAETPSSTDGSAPAGEVALEQIEEANLPAPAPAAGEPLGDLPGAGHMFKVRIASAAVCSKQYVVGTQPVLDVVKVRRFAGTDVGPIPCTSSFAEGEQ